jgi:hypothetical protein
MATVGQQLTAPETGWERYKHTDSNFSYTDGTWNVDTSEYDYHWSDTGKIKFNFTGTKLRILIGGYYTHSSSVNVYIDGIKLSNFSEATSARLSCVLACDIQNLTNEEHYIVIQNTGTTGFNFHAIDIDETGELKPYSPISNTLLRVTMLDSSEREYRLSAEEIDGFVNWYTRTIGTGSSCYSLSDSVDNSKEYLAFEKIISFKVVPVGK